MSSTDAQNASGDVGDVGNVGDVEGGGSAGERGGVGDGDGDGGGGGGGGGGGVAGGGWEGDIVAGAVLMDHRTVHENYKVVGRGGNALVLSVKEDGKYFAYKTFTDPKEIMGEIWNILALDDKKTAMGWSDDEKMTRCGIVEATIVHSNRRCRICNWLLQHEDVLIQNGMTEEDVDEQLGKITDELTQPFHYHVKMPTADGNVEDLFVHVDEANKGNDDEIIRRKTRIVHRFVQLMKCLTKQTKGRWVFADGKTRNVLIRRVAAGNPRGITGVWEQFNVELLLGDLGGFCSSTWRQPTVCTYGNPCNMGEKNPICSAWLNVSACIVLMVQALDIDDYNQLISTQSEIPMKERSVQAYDAIALFLLQDPNGAPRELLEYCLGKYWQIMNEQVLANDDSANAVNFVWDELLADLAHVWEL